MTVKEFLRSVRDANEIINRKQEQIARLLEMRTKAESTTRELHPDRVQGSGCNTNENLMIRMIDLEHEINAGIDHYIDLKRKAMALIDTLGDSRYIEILYGYYLEQKSWEQIAVDIGYSWRHVHRLHGEALRQLPEKMS